jgi:hypothetical protein
MLSDEGRYSAGNMYSPVSLRDIIPKLVNGANEAAYNFAQGSAPELDQVFENIRRITFHVCDGLFQQSDDFRRAELSKIDAKLPTLSKKAA